MKPWILQESRRYTDPVKNRNLATLLLISIAWHSLLGSMPAVASVCLGGGHVHTIDDDVIIESDCELACQHDPGLLVPLSIESQAENCGCTDIEFTSIDLLTTIRHDLDLSVALAHAPVCCWFTSSLGQEPSWRGPPVATDSNPGLSQQLRVVQITKLLL